ncbi:MAG: chlorite dismutase family protein [Candidatus Dormibacteraeota bacterium]|nr:chlorite dismutase family protein [Candidatus Dormibacteraeota bacterium]
MVEQDEAPAAWQNSHSGPTTEVPYVHALALGLDPAWRRLPEAERREDARTFVQAVEGAASVVTHSYSMVGLQPGVDLLVWRVAASLEGLEEAAAAALRTGLGRWLRVTESLLGVVQPSHYVKRHDPRKRSLLSGARARYLVVYPFTKSVDWYLQSAESRQLVMNEHMRVGHQYPGVRQLLANSFGIDDQDFMVAYDTDDLLAFSELVRALRATESRRATVRDTPILAGIARPLCEITQLLGG